MENQVSIPENGVLKNHHDFFQEKKSQRRKPFIESNTIEVELSHLETDCIIPVFAKDNERTISHQEFIEVSIEAVSKVLQGFSIEEPEIRVSHQIKGRVPEAIHKSAKDLLEREKTIYYERMAFVARIPSLFDSIGGNDLELSFGGVRSYNLENLYQKKGKEKFKFFIGFQNKVCCNLCISTDGYQDELLAYSTGELFKSIVTLVEAYHAEEQLRRLENFENVTITESQFAQVVGRCRLYQHLPKAIKAEVPLLSLNDGQFNTVVKDFYSDENFKRDESGEINLWRFYNLLTQANKTSYIDTFLGRNVNALLLSQGIQEALEIPSSKYNWYLS
ncbi:MAG: DUF3871 family protein [Flavobacteriaceae bacterium]|nr:DUF3871 family protein [Flavobacteriaceae bacterium]